MTRSRKLNQFLKKLLHMSRYDIQTSQRSSSRGLSFTSSEFSRSWGSSNRSAGFESVVDANSDCEDECCRSRLPHDVPAGCLPVYAGEERKRFVIPTSYLSNNIFRALLEKSEEEYGLRCQGGLRIACSPDVFEHFLWWLEGETAHNLEDLKYSSSGRSG